MSPPLGFAQLGDVDDPEREAAVFQVFPGKGERGGIEDVLANPEHVAPQGLGWIDGDEFHLPEYARIDPGRVDEQYPVSHLRHR